LEFNIPFQHKYGYIRDNTITLIIITKRSHDDKNSPMTNNSTKWSQSLLLWICDHQ